MLDYLASEPLNRLGFELLEFRVEVKVVGFKTRLDLLFFHAVEQENLVKILALVHLEHRLKLLLDHPVLLCQFLKFFLASNVGLKKDLDVLEGIHP